MPQPKWQRDFEHKKAEIYARWKAGEITEAEARVLYSWAMPTREDALDLLLSGAKPGLNPGATRGPKAGKKKAENLFGQLLDGDPEA